MELGRNLILSDEGHFFFSIPSPIACLAYLFGTPAVSLCQDQVPWKDSAWVKRGSPLCRMQEWWLKREAGKRISLRDTILRNVYLGKEILCMYPHMWLGKFLCALRGACTLIQKSLLTHIFILIVSSINHYAYLFAKGGRNLNTLLFTFFLFVYLCHLTLKYHLDQGYPIKYSASHLCN